MISVEKVTKYYGSNAAVQDLDFRIGEGECVGFLGLNGAGKSTTLRLLSCLLLPTSGRVTVRGIDAEQNPHEIRKLIGYLPDRPPLYPEMSVKEFLVFAGKLRGMASSKIRERLTEVISTCGLVDVADQAIGTLSHGYQQRVGIAQAIIHDPALLILDEPIQGLDPVQIVEMREMIRRLRGKHTILLSTHILSEIEQTCDRIMMLHEGKIAAQGTEDELVSKYRTGGTIEMEIRGTEQALRTALQPIKAVHELSVGALGEGLIRARFTPAMDVREDVSRAVVQAGLGLLAMRRVASGLESIFLKLHQHEIESSTQTRGAA